MKGFDEPILVTRPLQPDFEDVGKTLREVWDSKWLTNNGAKHKELEKSLKAFLDVEQLTLFSNGTLALMIGLKALGLTGEVITTPFTFPATVEVLDWNGLTPVFCDIEPETFNIDADQVESLITDKTSAILAVHVFGNPCDVGKLRRIAEKHHLKLVYDGAHAFGCKVDGIPIGCFGDMTMFSFHATKLFNTIEGGALTYRGNELYRTLHLMKNFGIASPDEVVLSGINAKLNELQSAVGLEVLKRVDGERAKRKQIMLTYIEQLAPVKGIRVLTLNTSESASFQYFSITVNADLYGISRDDLHEELKKYNIFTRKYFYPLCSDFPWYSHLESAKPEKLPQAQIAIREVLSLPFYGDLSIASARLICEIITHLGMQAGG